VRRVVLFCVKPFHKASGADLARIPHPDALHDGARTDVMTNRARHHGLRSQDVEGELQSGLANLGGKAASPELAA